MIFVTLWTSWKGYFYIHTNEDARDYKILRCKTDKIDNLEVFIQPKKGDCDRWI